MLEAQLESYFRRQVRLLGGYTIKLAPTEAGIPDRLVIFPGGRMFLVELKTDTGTLSPIQRAWHTKIRSMGGRVYTLYGRTGVTTWLNRVFRASDPAELNTETIAN